MEEEIISSHEPLARRLEQLRAQAAADRAQAALDRSRAARERAQAAVERARLDAELATAHLDGLTGAYRREMEDLMLSNEIARARRAGATPSLLRSSEVPPLVSVLTIYFIPGFQSLPPGHDWSCRRTVPRDSRARGAFSGRERSWGVRQGVAAGPSCPCHSGTPRGPGSAA